MCARERDRMRKQMYKLFTVGKTEQKVHRNLYTILLSF